jgi:hypothetical protein
MRELTQHFIGNHIFIRKMRNGMLLKVEEKLFFCVLQKNVGFFLRAKKNLTWGKAFPYKS